MDWKAGDIIILKRPERAWYSAVWTCIKQLFSFFVLRKGLIEAIDKWYHIEMAFPKFIVATMEPPACHLADIPKSPMRVYRMKNRPADFETKFYDYVKQSMKRKFDYVKFWALVVDRIFHTTWFSLKFRNPNKDVCGEWVSRFYTDIIGISIANVSPESAIPSDVNAYCRDNPDKFELVLDWGS